MADNVNKVILGMDLSLACPAFCVARVVLGKVEILHLSHITTNSKKGFGYRLFQIHNHVTEILKSYPITDVVKERGFAQFNGTTAKLRGVDAVVNLAVYQQLGIEEYPEIAPTTIKKYLTGNGRGEKEDVLNNIGRFLYQPVTLSHTKAKYDEADSIGVVISYAIQKKLLK
ncbi:crossover junction endodeoxyribonuclease RuvC [Cytobacillus firmus]|nr:crossover junction endodeoxyribonuclease RuvC [Cytobacillus firmus]